jgi:hypothetical protein
MEAIVFLLMHFSLLGRHMGKEGWRKDKIEEMEAIVSLLMHCSLHGRHVGKERRRVDKIEEMEAIVSLLMHCSLLGRHVGNEGRREDKLQEMEAIVSFNALFFTWQARGKEGGRKDKQEEMAAMVFYALFFTWQARGKRGRKGGHAWGAGIHGVSISPSEDGGSFEGCRHVLESGQVKLFLFLIEYRCLFFLHATYRTCTITKVFQRFVHRIDALFE